MVIGGYSTHALTNIYSCMYVDTQPGDSLESNVLLKT